MAATTVNLRLSNATNALIKAYGAAINAALSAVGLVQTADTGQINWTTTSVTATGAFQIFGYEIWRFSDSLQSTKPVFIKVSYGTGNTTSRWALSVQVGSATDGAGNLTTNVSTIRQGIVSGVSTGFSIPDGPAGTYPAWFSSDGSSLQMAFVPNTSGGAQAGNVCVWVVERTRNSDGTPNGDGLIYANHLASRTDGAYYSRFNYISFLTNSVVGTNFYWPIPYPGNNYFTGIDGATTYFYPFLVAMPKPEAQSLSILGMHSGDMPYFTTFSAIVNGSAHTYLCLPGVVSSLPGQTANENNGGLNNWCQIAMRYE